MTPAMKTVILYAVLLGGTMTASYLTWTSDEVDRTDDANAVEVYRAGEGDVQKLTYASEKLTVVVERREDALGSYPWVTIDETKETKVIPKHDHGAHDDEHGEDGEHDDEQGPEEGPDAEGEPSEGAEGDTTEEDQPPEPEIQVEEIHLEFRGNDNADGLLSSYEPLMAQRELAADAADPSVFGFDEPTGSITVARRSGGEVVLTLGGETYGSRDRYAKLDDRLFLLSSTAVKPLQFAASRTVERRLHPFAEQDVDAVELTFAGPPVKLTQKNPDDRKAAFWTRDGTEPDEEGSSWLEKLFRLRADQHGTDADVEGRERVLTAVITSSDGTHRIELYRGGEGDEVYARSDFLRGIAQLKKADALELLADAEDVFQQ